MKDILSHPIADKFLNSSLCQSRESIGIYIGDENIAITQIEYTLKDRTITLKKRIPNPAQNLPNSSPEDKEKIAAIIRENVGSKKDNLSEIKLGIPRRHAIVKRITIPAPEKKMVKDILKYEVEKHIPFKLSEAYYDFDFISADEGAKSFEVVLVAARKSSVDYYADIARMAKIDISGIDITTSATLNILAEGITDLTLHDNRPYITILKSGDYVEIILLLGREFIASRSIRGREDKLSKEIKKTLANSSESYRNLIEEPTIIIMGEGSLKESISAEIEKELGCKSQIASVSLADKNIILSGSADSTISTQEDILSYALTLRGSSIGLHLNLLPQGLRKRGIHQGITSLILAALILLLLLFIGTEGYLKEKSILKETDRQLTLLKKKASIVEDIYLRKDTLEKEFASFEHIRSSSTRHRDILRELTEILSSSVWLKEIDISESEIEILGYADNSSALINILEDSPLFNDIKFIGRIRKEGNKERFKVKGKIVGPDNQQKIK